jgi:hypothetical protein
MASFVKILTLVPLEKNQYKRMCLKMSHCLRKISFSSYVILISVANMRVNLDIGQLDVNTLRGFEQYKKEEELD